MKKLFLFLISISILTSATAQTFYFDKKLKVVNSATNAKYRAYVSDPSKPSKIVYELEGKLYAEGILFNADTLSFDGKVVFYDNRRVKAVQFYKKGILEPSINIDAQLKKSTSPSAYYLNVGANGEFAAFRKANPGDKNDAIIATGKVLDTVGLVLDSLITYYNFNNSVQDVKIYDKGTEKPFFSTTSDYKEPYNIIGIITHSVPFHNDIDEEMNRFLLKCKTTGGDGVVGVKTTPYFNSLGNSTGLIIQGTAIRLKKKE